MKVLKLISIGVICLALAGCGENGAGKNTQAPAAVSQSNTGSQTGEPESGLTGETAETAAAEGGKLSRIASLDFSRFSLHPLIKEFLETDSTIFSDKYGDDQLNGMGIRLDSALRFGPRFKDEVLEGVRIGIPLEELTEKLGKPSFSDPEAGLLGYKTERYYIVFMGSPNVQEISITKRIHIPGDYQNMLADFGQMVKDGEDFDGYEAFLEKYGEYYERNHIRGGGWNSTYPFGISFTIFEDLSVQVYNDFEGDLVPESPEITVEYIDEDSVFVNEKGHYSWEAYLQEEIQKSGVPSPDRKKAAYSDNETLYEQASVLVRFLDDSRADLWVTPGYFTANLQWLNDRYLFFTADLSGAFVYDVETDALIELISEYSGDLQDVKLDEFKAVDEESIQYVVGYTDGAEARQKEIRMTYGFNAEGDIVLDLPKD